LKINFISLERSQIVLKLIVVTHLNQVHFAVTTNTILTPPPKALIKTSINATTVAQYWQYINTGAATNGALLLEIPLFICA